MPSRKGSPDKRKQALIALLQQKYPGYQPVMEMAEAAHRLSALAMAADESESGGLWKDASTAHDKVAKYVTPQLQSIAVTGADGGPVQHSLQVEFVDPNSESVQTPVQTKEV